MPIAVVCECGKQVMAKDEFAGKRFKCPACGKIQIIPEADAGDGPTLLPGAFSSSRPPPAPSRPQAKATPPPAAADDLPEAGEAKDSDEEIPSVEAAEDEAPASWEKPKRRAREEEEEREETPPPRRRRRRRAIRRPIYDDDDDRPRRGGVSVSGSVAGGVVLFLLGAGLTILVCAGGYISFWGIGLMVAGIFAFIRGMTR